MLGFSLLPHSQKTGNFSEQIVCRQISECIFVPNRSYCLLFIFLAKVCWIDFQKTNKKFNHRWYSSLDSFNSNGNYVAFVLRTPHCNQKVLYQSQGLKNNAVSLPQTRRFSFWPSNFSVSLVRWARNQASDHLPAELKKHHLPKQAKSESN